MVPKPSTRLGLDDDPDLPELEELEEIEKKELEKVHQERVMAGEVCMEIVIEMVAGVEAVSEPRTCWSVWWRRHGMA